MIALGRCVPLQWDSVYVSYKFGQSRVTMISRKAAPNEETFTNASGIECLSHILMSLRECRVLLAYYFGHIKAHKPCLCKSHHFLNFFFNTSSTDVCKSTTREITEMTQNDFV